jgi:hypothetical protein
MQHHLPLLPMAVLLERFPCSYGTILLLAMSDLLIVFVLLVALIISSAMPPLPAHTKAYIALVAFVVVSLSVYISYL